MGFLDKAKQAISGNKDKVKQGIDTTAEGTRIVVANWFENTVTVVDAQSLQVVAVLDTCDGPRAFGRFIAGTAD